MLLEKSREVSCSLLILLFFFLEVHHLLVEMQEITVDSLLRLKLIQSFKKVRNPFSSSGVGLPVLIFLIILRSWFILLGRFGELGDLLMELFKSMLIEIALKAIIDPLSRHSVNQRTDHLDHSHVSLVLSLTELEL